VQAGYLDRAARLLLACHEHAAVAPFIGGVRDPALLVAYARACESGGDVPGALEALTRAGATDAVVALLCRPDVGRVDHAAELARRTRSLPAARAVAECLQARGDTAAALGMLLPLPAARDEAFALAAAHDAMPQYVAALLAQLAPAAAVGSPPCDSAASAAATATTTTATTSAGASIAAVVTPPLAVLPPAELARVCRFYESRGRLTQAGDLLAAVGGVQHEARALELFLASATEDAYERAIALVRAVAAFTAAHPHGGGGGSGGGTEGKAPEATAGGGSANAAALRLLSQRLVGHFARLAEAADAATAAAAVEVDEAGREPSDSQLTSTATTTASTSPTGMAAPRGAHAWLVRAHCAVGDRASAGRAGAAGSLPILHLDDLESEESDYAEDSLGDGAQFYANMSYPDNWPHEILGERVAKAVA
jgi:hypothetical protein